MSQAESVGDFQYKVLDLIRACTNPLGITIDEIREVFGVDTATAQNALSRIKSRKKLVVCMRGWRTMNYFPSQEALDAATPALVALRQQKEAEKAEADRLYQANRYRQPDYMKKWRAAKALREQRAPVAKVKKERKAKPGKELVTPPKKLTVSDLRGGPARLPGEPLFTAATIYTIAPPPPSVLYRSNTFSNH